MFVLLSSFFLCYFSSFPSLFLFPFLVYFFFSSLNEAMSAFCCCFSLYTLCDDWCCFEQVTWWHSYLYVFLKYLIHLSVQTEILRIFHLQTNAVFQPDTTPCTAPNPYRPVIHLISYATLTASEYSAIVSSRGQ